MSTDHYCTYFDHRYAAYGVAMLRSLRAQGGAGPVWILCLDPLAENIVRSFDLGDVRIVSLAALEGHFPGLIEAKANRTLIEYYFTLTAHILRYAFDQAPDARRAAYLDCDLFFFSPVLRVWAAVKDAPVAIIPHNFHKGAQHLLKYGAYNVGWVSFARSKQGMRCLDFWAASCREWCYDYLDDGKFADQGYLDRFDEFAPDLAILQDKGFNLAPWNVGRYRISLRSDAVFADEDPLTFFHFTGFKKGYGGRWFNSHRGYHTRTTPVMRDNIYRPFLAALVAARFEVAAAIEAIGQTEMRAVAEPTLNRGVATIRTRIYKGVERIYWLLDLMAGNALREPAPPSS